MGKYSIIVAARADKMLNLHVEFLARVSIPAARKLLEAFEDVINKLEENPFIYPVDEDPNLPQNKYRRALFLERYKALYCIENNIVYLDAIVDCRQNPNKI